MQHQYTRVAGQPDLVDEIACKPACLSSRKLVPTAVVENSTLFARVWVRHRPLGQHMHYVRQALTHMSCPSPAELPRPPT